MLNKEMLRISDFAGIRSANIELSRMNIFIGPQASGKSVCAKLFFFFKEIIRRTGTDILEGNSKPNLRKQHKALFLKYFPFPAWGQGDFTISYSSGNLEINVKRVGPESSIITIDYSPHYDILIASVRKTLKKIDSEEANSFIVGNPISELLAQKISLELGPNLGNVNYFIPAGRSFFSTLRGTVFSFIAGNIGIDPFLAEFGRLYETTRRAYNQQPSRHRHGGPINEHIEKLICGIYRRSGNSDFIVTSDDRQVAIENSSSGQQEALPLAMLLARIARTPVRSIHSTLFVEEPEAHLYPTAQREIVHLLAAATDLSTTNSSSQYIITTHSPYILSALNNLMLGEQVARQTPQKLKQIRNILGETSLIPAENVRAYSFDNGGVQPIINNETGLVEATMLDTVSNELASEFDALLDVAFEEQAA